MKGTLLKPLGVFFFLCLTFLPAILFADNLVLLEGSPEALGQRLRVFRTAQKELFVSTYLSRNDEVNALFCREMINAAKNRGVNVKYLIDGFTNEINHEVLEYMVANGVEVRVFRPISLNLLSFYNRSHGKQLYMDGKEAFIGGRNHWNKSYTLGEDGHLDTDVLIRGESVAKIGESFLQLWSEAKPIKKRSFSESDTKRIEQYLSDASALEGTKGFDSDGVLQGFHELPGTEVGSIEWLSDDPKGKRENRDAILKLIHEAKKELLIETPWIVLTTKTRQALLNAKKRGVDIQILTNSKRSSEAPIRHAVSRVGSASFLTKNKIKTWEFLGEHRLHSKYILVDGKKTYLGTFNFGPRSESNNFENGIVVNHEGFTEQVKQVFSDRVKKSIAALPYSFWLDSPCLNWIAYLLGSQH